MWWKMIRVILRDIVTIKGKVNLRSDIYTKSHFELLMSSNLPNWLHCYFCLYIHVKHFKLVQEERCWYTFVRPIKTHTQAFAMQSTNQKNGSSRRCASTDNYYYSAIGSVDVAPITSLSLSHPFVNAKPTRSRIEVRPDIWKLSNSNKALSANKAFSSQIARSRAPFLSSGFASRLRARVGSLLGHCTEPSSLTKTKWSHTTLVCG